MWNKIFVIILFWANFCFADQLKEEYIVGVEDTNYFPSYAFNSKGELIGVFREILDKFAHDAKVKLIYKPYKIREVYRDLFEKKIDLKFPDHPTWKAADKRDYNITYSDKALTFITGIFVLEENKDITLDKIKILGHSAEAILWSIYHYVEIKKIRIKNEPCQMLIDKLVNKEIDGIYYNYFAMQYELKKHKTSKIVFAPNLPYVDDYYYMSTIHHSDLIIKFNEWLNLNGNFIKEIMSKYYKS